MQTVASFWYTNKKYVKNKNIPPISTMEILAIKSWIDNGFEFILYTYDKDNLAFEILKENLNNFKIIDANEIVPFSEYFMDDRGAGVAAFSDYFRYIMVNQTGYAWVDLDMVCLKPHTFSEYVVIQEAVQIAGGGYSEKPTTSMLKYPQNSELALALINESKKIINGKKKVTWGVIGPDFLSKICEDLCNIELKNYKYSCAIHWWNAKEFTECSMDVLEDSIATHLWSEMWRLQNLDKNTHYDSSCIYEYLRNKHDVFDLFEKITFKYKNKENSWFKKILFKL